MNNKNKTISFYTLGCKVNQYETEILKEKFMNAGYNIVGEEEFADVYIVNTCTVTNLSDRKSRQHIRRLTKINPDAIIAVTGCYAQTSPESIAEIPGVSIIAGTNEKSHIVEYINNYFDKNQQKMDHAVESHIIPYEHLTEYENLGDLTSMHSRTRAYIKVQEGCDRFCSYCIIPYARGKVRSRDLNDIKREAESLIKSGFKEIVLTGINTALYGQDFQDRQQNHGIVSLIETISEINGDFRIRLSSLEPNVVDEETVKELLKFEKLSPHMHLSLQSGSDTVLRRMNRRYDAETYLRIVNLLKQENPQYAITTDIIAGFPGETDAEFEESLDMIDKAGFSKVHAFKYSQRKGTTAAAMDNQVESTVKNQRIKALMEKADSAADIFMQKNIGTIHRVLFEKYNEINNSIEGYTDNYIRVICKPEPAGNSSAPAGESEPAGKSESSGKPESAGKMTDEFAYVVLNEVRDGYMTGTITNTATSESHDETI